MLKNQLYGHMNKLNFKMY